ncbi:MAG: hypothetical protein DHS20C02_12080 [Micavibrio sp.]|nr:MAG: hypothetical protein DHS20C02_12080 [Micavibrio sp.]
MNSKTQLATTQLVAPSTNPCETPGQSQAEGFASSRKMQNIVRVPKVCKQSGFEDFTPPTMRHLIFNAEPRIAANGDVIPGNGLKEAGVILRIGKRVYIDLERFAEWILNHRES